MMKLACLFAALVATAGAGKPPPPSPPALAFDANLEDYTVLQMQPSAA